MVRLLDYLVVHKVLFYRRIRGGISNRVNFLLSQMMRQYIHGAICAHTGRTAWPVYMMTPFRSPRDCCSQNHCFFSDSQLVFEMLFKRYRLRKHTDCCRKPRTLRRLYQEVVAGKNLIALYDIDYSLCGHIFKVDHLQKHAFDFFNVFLCGNCIKYFKFYVVYLIFLGRF